MQSLFVLFACAAVAFAEYADEDDVVILTSENFESVIKGNAHVLVEFYAPWCGHCKNLEPHYKKAATQLKETGAILGALDATQHGAIASNYGVKGYPTLKWFSNGVASDYSGGRTQDTIVSWISKKIGPVSTELKSEEEIKQFTEKNPIAAIGFFAADSDAQKAFLQTAASAEGVAFGHSFDLTLGASHGLENGDGVVIYKPHDEGKDTIETYTAETLGEFIEGNRFPYVIPFTMEAVPRIFQSPIGLSALLFTHDPALEGLSDVAKEFKGKIVVATADDKENRLLEYIGVKSADFPKLFIINTAKGSIKYKLEGEVNVASIKAFFSDFFDGKLTPTLKSEDVPEANDEPVKVIVSKAFNTYVGAKHVFLEVYAPWCGHCKKLAPIWDELGALFASNENVVIGKMDGTLNEVVGVNVKGFPTIIYFAPGHVAGTEGETFEGARELDALTTFVNSKVGTTASHEEAKDEL